MRIADILSASVRATLSQAELAYWHDGLMILVVKLGAKIDKGSSTAPGQ